MKSVQKIILLFGLLNIPLVHSQDFLNHQWEKRVLLINVDCLSNDAYEKQLLDLKENEEGLLERKLVVYQIRKNEYKKGLVKDDEWLQVKGTALQALQEKLEFGVTLIGLDGWIKLQQSLLLSDELFSVIDAMPMRVQELRNFKKK